MGKSSQRVVVMGLGRFGGGVGVTRFLAQRGDRVLVTDQLPPDQLRQSLAQLADLPGIEYRLGEHRIEDFTRARMIVVNPAVQPQGNPYLDAARHAGVPLTSEIRLLVSHLPLPRLRIIGVTGTAGKSTTTAMIGHILQKTHGPDRVHVGGNIGGSLLERLDRIGPDDWVVLELSSFMLEGLREDGWSPHVAVITHFAPNHLDWHPTVEAYRYAKQALLDFQDPQHDAAVLGPGVRDFFTPRVRRVVIRQKQDLAAAPPLTLKVPGVHNQVNATLAADAAAQVGVLWEQAADAIADFPGLPHRLQFVAEHRGVRYFNDSKSTTPEAAQLAIESFPPHTVHVILGGYDKGSDLRPLARLAAKRCRAIYTIGKTGRVIAQAAREQAINPDAGARQPSRAMKDGSSANGDDAHALVIPCSTLDAAVREAVQRAKPGEVVLLSPGCASWDQFDHYEQRGSRFVAAVQRYTRDMNSNR